MRYAQTRAWIRENAKSETWQKCPFTAVRLVATWQGQEYHALGFAKCSPRDNWEFGLGEEIALSRAEFDLAKQLNPGNPYLPYARGIQALIDIVQEAGNQMAEAFSQAAQESAARKEAIPSDAPAMQCESEGQDG